MSIVYTRGSFHCSSQIPTQTTTINTSRREISCVARKRLNINQATDIYITVTVEMKNTADYNEVAYVYNIYRFSVLVTTSVGRGTWGGRCTS